MSSCKSALLSVVFSLVFSVVLGALAFGCSLGSSSTSPVPASPGDSSGQVASWNSERVTGCAIEIEFDDEGVPIKGEAVVRTNMEGCGEITVETRFDITDVGEYETAETIVYDDEGTPFQREVEIEVEVEVVGLEIVEVVVCGIDFLGEILGDGEISGLDSFLPVERSRAPQLSGITSDSIGRFVLAGHEGLRELCLHRERGVRAWHANLRPHEAT